MRFQLILCLLFLIAWQITQGLAAVPITWHVSSRDQLLSGELENLAVHESGQLMLGPQINELHNPNTPIIWALQEATDGALWLGTSSNGHIYRFSERQPTHLTFEVEELEVHALASGSDGSVYAGTNPNGKIYRLAPDGSVEPIFDPEETYIWALTVDPSGTLYAATGRSGAIYKITPNGEGEIFYDATATHIIALGFDPQGNLIATTESPGQVIRIDVAGNGFLLLESPFTEVRAITHAPDGSFYVAALRDSAVDSMQNTAITTGLPEADISTAVNVSTRSTQTYSSNLEDATGAVYHILPDGMWDIYWSSTSEVPYDLLIDSDGSLLIATGQEGRILRLSGNPVRATLLATTPAQQVTAFMQSSKGVTHFATANPGKVFGVTNTLAFEGTYFSEVKDATNISTWSTVKWRASTPSDSRVDIFTRSGNTRNPGKNWSAWSEAYEHPTGSHIESPKARYFQWKAVLYKGEQNSSPMLTSVTVSYLPRNLKPILSSVTAHPAGTVFQKAFSNGDFEIAGYDNSALNTKQKITLEAQATRQATTPLTGRRAYRKGLQTFEWAATDPDDNRLLYQVHYRNEGNMSWNILIENLWQPIFVWDTTSVPDGDYVIAITASDALANLPSASLTAQRESTVFTIDNTAPNIELMPIRQEQTDLSLSFVVQDVGSSIEQVEYSLDASSWVAAHPSDGIFDSQREEFEITITPQSSIAEIVVRATDVMNNTGTANVKWLSTVP